MRSERQGRKIAHHKRTYTEQDKASAYLTMQVNDFNMSRTSRDTGIPRPTLQVWRKEWEESGVPPDLANLAAADAKDFIDLAEQVRDQALKKLELLIPAAQPKDMRALIIIVGTLDDKIRLAQGLATRRTENVLQLPNAEDVQERMKAMIAGVSEAAKQINSKPFDIEGEATVTGLPEGE